MNSLEVLAIVATVYTLLYLAHKSEAKTRERQLDASLTDP